MRLAAVTLLLATLALTACDDDEDFILPVIEGQTFFLRTANGRSLPAVITDDTGRARLRVEVVAGTLTLGRNGTFTDEIVFRERRGDAVVTRTRLCQGTFITGGNTASFSEAASGGTCGETFTGVLRIETLTTTIQGIVLVWSPRVISRRF